MLEKPTFHWDAKASLEVEINTQPGMTDLSLVPEIAAYKGIKFENLVEWMVKDADYAR